MAAGRGGGGLAGWRLALRVARREAWRSRGRSLLVLVLVALPVVVVTAAAVLVATARVDGEEGLERRIGGAQASLEVQDGVSRVVQDFDPTAFQLADGEPGAVAPTRQRLSTLVDEAPMTELRRGSVRLVSEEGVTRADVVETDLDSPLTEGLFGLVSGRWPAGEDEVVVNAALADQGYAVGDRLEPAEEGSRALVVGIAESAAERAVPIAAGPPGSLALEPTPGRTWLVGGDPLVWDDVLALNEAGAAVVSRAVLTDRPPPSALSPEVPRSEGPDSETVTVLALVVAMVVLEVVLLAGPAFAVGAKRQARSLALMSSAGASPAQARRTVLASALVLGGVASLVGALLGLLVAAAALPAVQRLSSSYLGPYDVPWLAVAGVAGFGVLSAVLAALVPAVLASRQDVVAVLAGRRGEPRPSRRSPVLGAVLLATGVAASVLGAQGRGPLLIAASALLCVAGTVLLVPVLLSLAGRCAGRLPLVLRYAVRDAARQRTRTAPAVAAVAATVAGVVTLGIGASSDAREREETYRPLLALGSAVVQPGFTPQGDALEPDWPTTSRVVTTALPEARVTPVTGVVFPDTDTYLEVRRPGSPAEENLLDYWSASLGSDVLVGSEALSGLPWADPATVAAVERVLAEGRVAVFTDQDLTASSGGSGPPGTVALRSQRYDPTTGEPEVDAEVELPATYLSGAVLGETPRAVLPPAAAAQAGLTTATVGLLVEGATISADQQERLDQALAALPGQESLLVERGFVPDDLDTIVLLVLFVAGGALVLGGTLTATFLALADARSDLTTLAAVGAAPRTRRGIGAAYAVSIGLLGSVLGAAVGFVPGTAIAVTLTTVTDPGSTGVGETTGPFLDVPWPAISALVVGLPLLSAAVVALSTRSRLPSLARAA